MFWWNSLSHSKKSFEKIVCCCFGTLRFTLRWQIYIKYKLLSENKVQSHDWFKSCNIKYIELPLQKHTLHQKVKKYWFLHAAVLQLSYCWHFIYRCLNSLKFKRKSLYFPLGSAVRFYDAGHISEFCLHQCLRCLPASYSLKVTCIKGLPIIASQPFWSQK